MRTHAYIYIYICIHVVVMIELRLHEYVRPCPLALCQTLSRPHLPCMREYLSSGDSVILNEDACVGLSIRKHPNSLFSEKCRTQC